MLDDPRIDKPEVPRETGVLDMVNGRPPGRREEPSMTTADRFDTRGWPANVKASRAGGGLSVESLGSLMVILSLTLG